MPLYEAFQPSTAIEYVVPAEAGMVIWLAWSFQAMSSFEAASDSEPTAMPV